jgi:hypothetical protein
MARHGHDDVSPIKDELLVRLGTNIYPQWMRAGLATLIRYFGKDSHQLRTRSLMTSPTTSRSS